MITRQGEICIAEDGKEFLNKNECLLYEAEYRLEELLSHQLTRFKDNSHSTVVSHVYDFILKNIEFINDITSTIIKSKQKDSISRKDYDGL